MSDNREPGRELNRRDFMKVSSLLALGLVYQKPAVETLTPQAALGQYGGGGTGGGGIGGGETGGGGTGGAAPLPLPPRTTTYHISTGLFTVVVTVTASEAGCITVSPSNSWHSGGWSYTCRPGCTASVTVDIRNTLTNRLFSQQYNIQC